MGVTSERYGPPRNGYADQAMPKMFIHPTPLTPGVRRTRIQAHFVRKRAMLRYARTSYDSVGRYVTASRLPFATAAGARNEQPATQVTARDEFGNATGQSAINGTTQTARGAGPAVLHQGQHRPREHDHVPPVRHRHEPGELRHRHPPQIPCADDNCRQQRSPDEAQRVAPTSPDFE